MDVRVETWFPVSIFVGLDVVDRQYNNVLHQRALEIKDSVVSGGQDWYGGTYTTHNRYDLREDPVFSFLIDLVTEQVNRFAGAHNSNSTYTCGTCWLNIAEAGNYQEFHTHENSIFSAVYYVSAPSDSGNIIFCDPKEPDMFPLRNIVTQNQLSLKRVSYPAVDLSLLIFRSYLSHMVEPGQNQQPRISISMNFI